MENYFEENPLMVAPWIDNDIQAGAPLAMTMAPGPSALEVEHDAEVAAPLILEAGALEGSSPIVETFLSVAADKGDKDSTGR